MEQIQEIEKALEQGEHPMKYKKQLAYELVKQLNNQEAAQQAQEHFERTVQKKEMPTEIPTINLQVDNGLISYIDLLLKTNLASSRSEAKRLIEQGGVEVDNEKVTNPNEETTIKDEVLIKVGKRKFVKVISE